MTPAGPGAGRTLVLLLSGGAALVLVGMPAGASTTEGPASPTSRAEREALALLSAAAAASRDRAWSGTQHVATWSAGSPRARTVQLRHDPDRGTSVTTATGAATVPAAAVDQRLLAQLAARFDLTLAGSDSCSGRRAVVVEARRPDGRVAGRFWLDRDTHLPLRREVRDAQGRPLRSSTFVDLEIGPRSYGASRSTNRPAAASAAPSGAGVTAAGPGDTGDAGWRAPTALPGGYALFESSRSQHGGGTVTHRAYSDGLSTVSVFSQPGSLGGSPGEGFREERVAGSRVWVRDGVPERLVWNGDGQVFTLVSDAGPADLRAAVRALPHDRAPDTGAAARLQRGLGRLGSWLNPLS